MWPLKWHGDSSLGLLLGHQGEDSFVKTAQFLFVVGCRFNSKPETRNLKLTTRAAKPFVVELIIGAVLFQLEQRFVNPFAQRALDRESNAVVFLAKDRADGLRFAFAFMGGVVEQNRRVIDDGVDLRLLRAPDRLLQFWRIRSPRVLCWRRYSTEVLPLTAARRVCRADLRDR